MKVGSEDKKKRTIAAVLGGMALIAVVFLYNTLFGGPSTPPSAPPVVVVAPAAKTGTPTGRALAVPAGNAVGKNAQRVGSANEALDPTLHMEAMLVTESLVYTGTGRNIFAAGSVQAPVQLVQAKFPPRPVQAPVQTAPVNLGPPPPPRINLKFFGTATTSNGSRRALLLNGDDVYLASVGDVVQRRYRVISISANSVLVEDIPNSNQQSLPLMSN